MSAKLIGTNPQPGGRPSPVVPQSVSPAAVTIWPFDLEIDEFNAARWFTGLTPDEQARSKRFVQREHQRRFIACRYRLRQILALLSGIRANEIRFHYGAYGKPELCGVAGLHFSVAHSDGIGVVSTCAVAPVGVDLEVMTSHEEVAGSVLTGNELTTLQAYTGNRDELFLRYWTGKEAFLKLWGIGLSLEPRTIEIDWDDPPVCRPLSVQDVRVKSAWLALTPAYSGAICAIACELPPIVCVRTMDFS
jgi:4'-phosphopantetheinyl transferase